MFLSGLLLIWLTYTDDLIVYSSWSSLYTRRPM